jgi:hypothetical protein
MLNINSGLISILQLRILSSARKIFKAFNIDSQNFSNFNSKVTVNSWA